MTFDINYDLVDNVTETNLGLLRFIPVQIKYGLADTVIEILTSVSDEYYQ